MNFGELLDVAVAALPDMSDLHVQGLIYMCKVIKERHAVLSATRKCYKAIPYGSIGTLRSHAVETSRLPYVRGTRPAILILL